MFEGILLNLLILIVSLLVLSRASHLTITNAVNTADATGLGRTTVGFLLVAFSTSLPELLVSIFAALGAGTVGVAVGNVLGSNIVNVCLILGVCILMVTLNRSMKTNCLDFTACIAEEEVGSLYFGLFMASIIPLSLIYIREASRFVGVVLLVIFIFNTYQMFRERTSVQEEVSERERRRLLRYASLVFVGVAGVVGSAYFLVDAASSIARALGVPGVVIGATIVAFGTSVPELATSIESTRQGHLDMAFGNIVGSGFVNLTLILGITLVASPFTLNMVAFSDLALFSLIANLFLWYFMSSGKITVREGMVLLGLYIIFLTISFGDIEFKVVE
jgi:cation:H+ antiporter